MTDDVVASFAGAEITAGPAASDPASVRRILESLPDWFGDRPSLEEYVRDAEHTPTYLAHAADGSVVGVLLFTQHFPECGEVHLLAADPAWHRRGVGRALIEAVAADQRAAGAKLLQVKTLGPSAGDEYYARTLRFYRALGFLPVEEQHGLWGSHPSLMLVKVL